MQLTMVWKKICALEAKSAWLYGFYADVFDFIPQVRAFFLEMREEELVHFNQAAFHQRLVNHNSARFADIDVRLDGFDELISEMDDHVKNGVFDVKDALNFALYLEENAREIQVRSIAGKSDPDLDRLCSLMHTEDDGHVQKIRGFADQWTRHSG